MTTRTLRARAFVTLNAALACVLWSGPSAGATITREVFIEADPAMIWDAIRDVGAVDKRIAPGFVVSDVYDGRVRTVTFANGKVVREAIISIDDAARRVAYTSVGGKTAHHNASMQVVPLRGGARVIWITDVLPDEAAPAIADLMEQGLSAMKRALAVHKPSLQSKLKEDRRP